MSGGRKSATASTGLRSYHASTSRTRDLKANFAAYDNALRKARKASLSLWEISIINDAMPSGLTLPLGIGVKQVDERICRRRAIQGAIQGNAMGEGQGREAP